MDDKRQEAKNTNIEVRNPGWLEAVLAFLFLALAVWLALYLWRESDPVGYTSTMTTVAYVLMGVVALIGLAGFAWLGNLLYQSARAHKANADRVTREANVAGTITAGPTDQVWAQETHGVTFKAMHLDPRLYSNGNKGEAPTPDENRRWLARMIAVANGTRQVQGEVVPDEVAQPINLLEASREFERVLVVGNSGSGKTTLLQHLVASREGQVVVLDPHDDTHTWPENAQVIGGGQDYETIESMLVTLRNQLRERYQTRSSGAEMRFGWLWVVMDEWREITKNAESAGENMRILLTGGRKVRMGVIVGTHSDRAKPLGIEGEADLKDGFAVIRLFGDKQRGFRGTLDIGNGEMQVVLPGPFTHRQLPAPAEPVVIDQPKLSGTEDRVLNAFDSGERKISHLAEAGYGVKGGWQSDQAREIIRKHRGVEV